MKTWHDEALLLGIRRHHEHAGIASVLSKHHGLYTGFVHGYGSKKHMGTWQAGNILMVRWRARLDAHMGSFTHTPEHGHANPIHLTLYNHRQALACLVSALTLVLHHAQPRQEERQLYHSLCALRHQLQTQNPPQDTSQDHGIPYAQSYACWEYDFLAMMGYGLDLRNCASGIPCHDRDLVYVSPKSGRAVSADAGKAWADKLLPLPPFLRYHAHHTPRPSSPVPVPLPVPSRQDIRDALNLNGYFLEKHLHHKKPLPRQRHFILQ